MSSSSLPLRASQDGSPTINGSAPTESTADRDDLSDVPLLSNLQLNDRRPSETGSLLRAGSSTSELAYRGTTIEDLPDELILEIFSYVSSSENINVLQEVSTRWKILAQDAHLWCNWKYVVRSITPLLLRVETLQKLELINDLGLGEAAEALPALGQLHSLRRLRLVVDNSEVRHSVPAVFRNGGLSNLQQVSLEGYTADETTRALAEHCSELRELELVKCEGHRDALLEPLCRLKKLEKLKIFSCGCLGGKAMSYIAKLPALRTLEFLYIKFDKLKPSVDCFLEMSQLHRLYIHECICFAIPFDKFPGRLVNLRELEIGYCDGDQEVLDRVCAQMPELKVTGSLGAWITDDEDYDDYYGEDDD